MSKIAHYLQEHLVGEVMTSTDARRYFATDASVLTLPPALVVYPRNENDVRKVARFTWQLAERGRVIPITARGSGTDQTGAALGGGVMLVFPAHMNRVLAFEGKSGTVSVEPGLNFGKLQQTLQTHTRFLPPYPASQEYSTIGGALANNASGEKSVKYGDTRGYVTNLRVVLANGEVIETGRLNKRDLSKKLGLSTLEGEIYRAVDTLLEEQREVVNQTELPVRRNTAGYDLLDIKRNDGSFDLTPLFVGSQGTLGIITEAVLETEAYNPETTLLVASFDSLAQTQAALNELLDTKERPSALEMIDGRLLELVQELNPNQLKDLVQPPFPATVLFVEFDEANDRQQHKAAKRAQKILDHYAIDLQISNETEKQQQFWKLRQATATVLGHAEGPVKAVPLLLDGVVPPDRTQEYLEGVYALCEKNGVRPAVWGQAGDGIFHLQPLLNIGQVGDRQRAFRLMDEYYRLVFSLGGSTSGRGGDGRLRAPYLEATYGSAVYELFGKIKQIFDPYGTLNPGVKMGVKLDDIKPLLRHDYNLEHFYDHMPRS